MFTNWINAGYIFVGYLFTGDNLVTLDYICANLGPDANLIFQYNAMYNSLSADWRNLAVVGNFGGVTATFRGQDLPQVTTKFVRDNLVQSRAKPPCINFWNRRFPLFDVSNTFSTAINATKEIRLRVLHWKITHSIYPTNILLHKMGLSNTKNCNLCEEKDYIEHFFRMSQSEPAMENSGARSIWVTGWWNYTVNNAREIIWCCQRWFIKLFYQQSKPFDTCGQDVH